MPTLTRTTIAAECTWAKIDRAPDGGIRCWHSLLDHSADVAAVVRALLELPIMQRRLACTLGKTRLEPVLVERLVVLAALHDAGKANRGFQKRREPGAALVGHIEPLAWLIQEGGALVERLDATLGLGRTAGWFTGSTAEALADIVLAHHGRPVRRGLDNARSLWCAGADGEPIARLAPLRQAIDRWCTGAFADGPPVAGTTYFDHAFAGLLMLADWIGSDTQFFPMANGRAPDRMADALPRARQALRTIGLDVERHRQACREQRPEFTTLFNVAEARPIQSGVIEPRACLRRR